MAVAVLFARADSVYKTLPDCDVFDQARDARTFAGGVPVVAHPPCAQWSRLRYFAHDVPAQKALAPWAVEQVRAFGGVLEHPEGSKLWPHMQLPEPGRRDAHGGWTLGIRQWDFGHRASKLTRLYIVGVEPARIPVIPLRLGDATHVVSTTSKKLGGQRRPALRTPEREHTPIDLACWLVAVARAARGGGLGLSL